MWSCAAWSRPRVLTLSINVCLQTAKQTRCCESNKRCRLGEPEAHQRLVSLNTNQNPAGHLCLCSSLRDRCQPPAAVCELTLARRPVWKHKSLVGAETYSYKCNYLSFLIINVQMHLCCEILMFFVESWSLYIWISNAGCDVIRLKMPQNNPDLTLSLWQHSYIWSRFQI